MTALIRKYRSATFYIIVLIVSGLLLVIQSYIPTASEYSLTLPQLAPTLAVILFCWLTRDTSTFKRIYKSIPLATKDFIWIPIILGLTILADILTAGILSLAGISYQTWDGTVINALFMIAGCFFEELGWRGFLLPQLERRYSPLASSLIVGFLWGLWHMSFQLGLVGFLIFIVTAIELSILMTWIYHKTNGNLMLMTLWHVSINILHQVLLTGRLTATGFAVSAVVFAVFCSLVFAKNQSLYLIKRMMDC